MPKLVDLGKSATDPNPGSIASAPSAKRIATIALERGESITDKVKELTNGQGAGVLAELAPGGIESTIECIKNLEPGGRVALIAPKPEPLNLPLRYLMIRSIEFTSVTGRFAMDVAELLQLVQRGVIDARHITTRYFPLTAVNEALDYIKTRGDSDPLWPMYAAE